MSTALDMFLRLTDLRGDPILAKAGEVRAISVESHQRGDGPGRVIVDKHTRVDFVEAGWYLVQETVEEIAAQLEAMELDD